MRVGIIGGTGFVGSYIVDALERAGHSVSLLVRPDSDNPSPEATNRRTVAGDLESAAAIEEVLGDCDAAIYLVGILRANPKQGITFEEMQLEGAVRMAKAAVKLGVRRFLLMSANGVEARSTPYQRTKYDAEQRLQALDLDLSVFRPSVVFGDPRGRMEFATQLYQDLVRPPIPAIGFYSGLIPPGRPVLMAPVHVQDVADAFVAALADPATIGKTFCLGGPDALSWTDMLRRIAATVGKRKIIIPMPIPVMRLAAMLLDWIPQFPVTRDQLIMLEQNNVCDAAPLEALIARPSRAFDASNLDYLTEAG